MAPNPTVGIGSYHTGVSEMKSSSTSSRWILRSALCRWLPLKVRCALKSCLLLMLLSSMSYRHLVGKLSQEISVNFCMVQWVTKSRNSAVMGSPALKDTLHPPAIQVKGGPDWDLWWLIKKPIGMFNGAPFQLNGFMSRDYFLQITCTMHHPVPWLGGTTPVCWQFSWG